MPSANRRIVFLAAATIFLGAARDICAQSPAAGSGDAVALNNRGLELYQKGKIDGAAALFRQALALNPDFPEALSNLGMVLDLQGKDEEAVADFDKALAIRPTDGVAESNLGLALYHEKKYYDSISAYQKAIVLNPKFAQAYNGMGAALCFRQCDGRDCGLPAGARTCAEIRGRPE
jgi:tetratricopeptide (TPR) repeat protein